MVVILSAAKRFVILSAAKKFVILTLSERSESKGKNPCISLLPLLLHVL